MANHQEVGQGIEWPEYILGRVDKVPVIQASDGLKQCCPQVPSLNHTSMYVCTMIKKHLHTIL